MRTRLVAALLLSACGSPDAACPGDDPVQVLQRDYLFSDLRLAVLGDQVMFVNAGPGTQETVLAGPCGAAGIVLADVPLAPMAARLEQPDLDPELMCDTTDLTMLRVDLTGERAPELLLPGHMCPIASKHGAISRESTSHDNVPAPLWLLPNFPAGTDARRISAVALRSPGPVVRGDTLLYVTESDELHAHDLGSGADRVLATEVHDFETTADQVVVSRSTAPGLLIDLADDRRIELASADFDRWYFGSDERYLLRSTQTMAGVESLAAFDLDGQALALPADRLAAHRTLLADGRLLFIAPDGAISIGRPGTMTAVDLDIDWAGVFGITLVADEWLETHIERGLWRVPLDGRPAELVAEPVGVRHLWLDATRLLTVVDDVLVIVDTTDGAREVLDEDVGYVGAAPVGGGVYYVVDSEAADESRRGVWYLPAGGLR